MLNGIDAPWCSMTSTHASRRYLNTLPNSLQQIYFPPATKPENYISGKAVKGRNEPAATGGVAWVISNLHEGISFEEIVGYAWRNTVEVFGLEELRNV